MEKSIYEAPESKFVRFEMGDIIATYTVGLDGVHESDDVDFE